MTAYIPFNVACFTGREIEYVTQAIEGHVLAGDGPFTQRCSILIEQLAGGGKALLTTSCTHALEMAALLLDVQPGDEIVCPGFTFVSTINAFVLRGARPVFVDVRPDTLNLDERQLERALSPRTRAIIVMHYAGIACEMEAITGIARAAGIPIVEDNAHGLCGRYRDRPLGSFGVVSTLSFHETKNFTCGEGGALLINDPSLVGRAEILREKGTDRSRFFRGEIDKYTWVDLGSSYLPSDLLAAYLCAQLERAHDIQDRRQTIWNRYVEGLAWWAAQQGVTLPSVPDACEPAWHLFYMVMPSLEARQDLIRYLKGQQIGAVFHYQALHLSAMGRRLGGEPGQCPVTERVADCLVRLPFFFGLGETDQARVIDAVTRYRIGSGG